MILNRLRPLLHAKWEADPAQPDFIIGYTEYGSTYLVTAPPPLRDLLVLMQNNLSMQLQYIDALAAELDQSLTRLESIAGDQEGRTP